MHKRCFGRVLSEQYMTISDRHAFYAGLWISKVLEHAQDVLSVPIFRRKEQIAAEPQKFILVVAGYGHDTVAQNQRSCVPFRFPLKQVRSRSPKIHS